jgi:hypothetical protein
MNLATTSDNLVLLLIFFGFYLVDCIVLLKPAQALARMTPVRPRRGQVRPCSGLGTRWRVSLDFGLTFYPVRGRYLALLNPLTPFVAVFKTRPIDESGANPAAPSPLTLHQMMAIRIRMARLSVALVSHGVLMFIILPVLLLSGQTTRLLIALAAAFLSAILILAVCHADRRAARLPTAGFWAIAGQALLCLPTSLNAPRKLALLAPAAARTPELLPSVPEDRRAFALGELRLTLERAAGEGPQGVAEAAETMRRALAADYPEV